MGRTNSTREELTTDRIVVGVLIAFGIVASIVGAVAAILVYLKG
jgi:hypothetical protein